MVTPSGSLCSRMATNTMTPSVGPTRNALAMATPSKQVCSSSPTRAPRSRRGVHRVRLFSEVEMGRYRMLREMHRQVSGQHKEGAAGPPAGQRFRHDLREAHRQHEAGAERDEMVDHPEAARGVVRITAIAPITFAARRHDGVHQRAAVHAAFSQSRTRDSS